MLLPMQWGKRIVRGAANRNEGLRGPTSVNAGATHGSALVDAGRWMTSRPCADPGLRADEALAGWAALRWQVLWRGRATVTPAWAQLSSWSIRSFFHTDAR